MTIYFDMDGTIADLYGVENWLDDLINGNSRPYEIAKPMVNLSSLAKQIHRLEKLGFTFGIISWLAKNSNADYDEAVTIAKQNWLKKHLPSVHFAGIHIVKYGTPKSTCGNGILFDDEKPNLAEWGKGSFHASTILETLKSF